MYNEYIEDEIIFIEEMEEDIETMDIEVDGDHLFDANGILTHNSSYDHKEHLNLAQMGESIKKVEHSDFVALIRSHKASESDQGNFGFAPSVIDTNGTMSVYIGKNRSGAKEKLITLKTNFEAFRIDDSAINNSIPFKDTEELEDPAEVLL